jgi:methionyl-tRNA formyltransferase
MRVAVLCNDRIALPALDYLLGTGLAVGVGMPARTNEMQLLTKQRCQAANIPFTLFNKKDLVYYLRAWLDDCKPDVVLVKTFPFLIPEEILNVPRYGFINFHYAPLPAWRGSNPLFWMVRNRASQGGVSVHEMTATYDTGAILVERSLSIGTNINFGIFYTQLAYIGLQLTQELLPKLHNGQLQKRAQDPSQANWYSHPKPSDLFIDWQTMDAEEIAALIKACNPWNKGAGTRWNGWTFGITYASVGETVQEEIKPGTVLSIDPVAGFTISTKDRKTVIAEVVYCEEGFYPGYCLSAFGLQKNHQLS